MTKAYRPANGVLSWAHDIDDKTLTQVNNSASLPFVNNPVALMADAHLGYGVPIGTVLATKGAIIPSAVGVDLGCGVIGQKLSVKAADIDLDGLHDDITRVVPAGQPTKLAKGTGTFDPNRTDLTGQQAGFLSQATTHTPDDYKIGRVHGQFGTLGGGNHFVEVCEDENGDAWVTLHSGSRGVGNAIAKSHIENAKGLMKSFFIELNDPDLAYLVEGTPEFDTYIAGMLWAQDYAAGSRALMMTNVLKSLANRVEFEGDLCDGDEINRHHNYTCRENHHGKNMWITRKGATSARQGELSIIPGSMATGSYVVEGLGNPASYTSASHGAGRKMSRTAARKNLTAESLDDKMSGISWNRDADSLLDEHPDAYKKIEEVMEAQDDLVKPVARLTTLLNFKGA